MFEAEETEEVAPYQLENEPVCRLVGLTFLLITLHLSVDVTGRQTAVGKPRRKLAAVISAYHAVASLEVYSQAILVPEIMLHARQRRGLTAAEGQHAARVGLRRVFCFLMRIPQGGERRRLSGTSITKGGRDARKR